MPDLTAALRAVLPPGVALGQAGDDPPWPGEVLPGALPARLAEFARGRSAARAAIRALGAEPAAIRVNPDRSPEWPAGLTGSISHCAGACLAVAARRADFAGLGLDLEPMRPLDPDFWPVILRPEEQGLDPLTVFVIKEAAYKAQFALTATLFDFHTLSVSMTGGRFTAIFQQTVPPFAAGDRLLGRTLRSARHIGAFCAIPAA